MDDIIFRKATIKDIHFIVDVIIEAEKSGTDRLSYSTIFGLSEDKVRKHLVEMLSEEIDGCGELSISSYLLAENRNELIAAACAWVEGAEGLPTAVLKGNILNFILPRKAIDKAVKLQEILHELHFDYEPNVIHMGAGYVEKKSRGKGLLKIIKEKQLNYLVKENPKIREAYVDTFEASKAALRTSEKLGFIIVEVKEASSDEILKYLPSKRKYFLKKKL